ncbi:hypothetical protein GGR51DRAFT_566809 [Nemania sp. FL0031]|nr:hypothetical protein GGR51DRAFT_566809 [Nemania sp. FL0031]
MDTEYQRDSARAVQQLWNDVSAQIDDHNKIIILNIDVLNRLNDSGKRFFIYRCSLLLGKPADFCRDGEIPSTVYLGNADDLQQKYDAVIIRDPTDEFAVLFRRTSQGRRIFRQH